MFSLATHNGTITLRNPETGEHRTFNIATRDFKGEERRVLSLLVGPDNTSDFQGFAFVLDTGVIRVWRRFREFNGMSQHERLAKCLQSMRALEESGRLEVFTEGRCRRCNRTLTTPESVESGIGPVCREKEMVDQ